MFYQKPKNAAEPPQQDTVYKALPAQVDETACSLDTLHSLQTNTTTTSDDSDTVRVYDFNKQETTIIKASAPVEEPSGSATTSSMESAQSATPSTSSAMDSSVCKKRERPVVLQFGPGDSAPTIGSPMSTPTRGSTPPAFRFLQPKRRLIEPSQILSIDHQDEEDDVVPTIYCRLCDNFANPDILEHIGTETADCIKQNIGLTWTCPSCRHIESEMKEFMRQTHLEFQSLASGFRDLHTRFVTMESHFKNFKVLSAPPLSNNNLLVPDPTDLMLDLSANQTVVADRTGKDTSSSEPNLQSTSVIVVSVDPPATVSTHSSITVSANGSTPEMPSLDNALTTTPSSPSNADSDIADAAEVTDKQATYTI